MRIGLPLMLGCPAHAETDAGTGTSSLRSFTSSGTGAQTFTGTGTSAVTQPTSAGTGTTFQPSDLTGLQLWTRGGVAITNSGGFVQAWGDQSGNSNNVAQAVGALDPVYNSAPLNGFATVNFASSLYLDANNVAALAPAQVSMFVVGRTTSTNTIQFFGGRGDTSTAGYWLGILNSSGNNHHYWHAGNGTVESRIFSTDTIALNTWYVITGMYDLTNVTLRVNGTQKATTPMTGNLNYAGSLDFILGNTTGLIAARSLVGDEAEVLIFNPALSLSDTQKVERYLGFKYGLAVA